jgi:dCTP deaminase
LTLGTTILTLPPADERNAVNIDFTQHGNIPATLSRLYDAREMDSTGFRLLPNQLILAKTNEKITLPLTQINGKPLLAARVEGKSSFARCGLLIHFTAPTIHAGFSGTITLEIICLGGYAIHLTPGMQICQLLIEEVLGQPEAFQGQFHGQTRPAGPST